MPRPMNSPLQHQRRAEAEDEGEEGREDVQTNVFDVTLAEAGSLVRMRAVVVEADEDLVVHGEAAAAC